MQKGDRMTNEEITVALNRYSTDVFRWWMEDGVLPGQVELEEMDV